MRFTIQVPCAFILVLFMFILFGLYNFSILILIVLLSSDGAVVKLYKLYKSFNEALLPGGVPGTRDFHELRKQGRYLNVFVTADGNAYCRKRYLKINRWMQLGSKFPA